MQVIPVSARGVGAGLAVLAGLHGPPAWPQADDASDRRYVTREERRDEGPRHALFAGARLGLLAEYEYEEETRRPREGPAAPGRDQSATVLESVLEWAPRAWTKLEFVHELDSETDKLRLDEAIWSLEAGPLELELGRFYLPFGEYISHFATGPLLEFGETRARAASLNAELADWAEVALGAYRQRSGPVGAADTRYGWALALQFAALDFATLGLSYLSSLADAQEGLLEDAGHRYVRRVGALSGYLSMGHGPVEFSAEFVRSLGRFAELEDDRDRPTAWNAELAYYPGAVLGLILRAEGSSELDDEPCRRQGLALSIDLPRHAFVTLEYLRGEFAPGFAEDDQERELDRADILAVQLSVPL